MTRLQQPNHTEQLNLDHMCDLKSTCLSLNLILKENGKKNVIVIRLSASREL